MKTDISQRVIFENADIRGERVQLSQSLQEAFKPHAYPAVIKKLLGELTAAAVLLSTTLKFEGRMTLQARSSGPVTLLMVECTDALNFRGISHWNEQLLATDTDTNIQSLLPDGHLVITIDPTHGKRHQGFIPLEHITLSDSFTAYFEQSEQLPTRLWLTSDGEQAGGFLLQALPARKETDAKASANLWEHAVVLAETLKEEEQLNLPTKELLHRLYHDQDVRLFDPREVNYHCTCSRERTGNALITLPQQELLEILEEQGEIDMDCQFCNTRYVFTKDDIKKLLGAGETRQ